MRVLMLRSWRHAGRELGNDQNIVAMPPIPRSHALRGNAVFDALRRDYPARTFHANIEIDSDFDLRSVRRRATALRFARFFPGRIA